MVADTVNACPIQKLYLDVFVIWQAGGNAGQGVVVQVQLTQVRDVGQGSIFHRANLVVAQTQPASVKQMWEM